MEFMGTFRAKKIILINYEYPPIGAGAGTATYHIARALAHQGHIPIVFTSKYRDMRGLIKEEGILIYRCFTFRKKKWESNIFEMASFLLSGFLTLPRIIKDERVDAAIIFFSLPCGPLGLYTHFLFGLPYVVSLRGGDVPGNEPSLDKFHKFFKPLRRLILKNSIAVIANSEGLKHLSEKKDPYAVKVIPNGVDFHFFTPRQKTHRVTRFLFVGRFREQKNLFYLLKQMNILSRKIHKNFELHLVGDGPLKAELQKYSRKLSIRNKVFWHSWCDNERLKCYYQNADCLISTSKYEGMSNVLLEAMACALPVVASNVIGNNTLVKHGETGFLFALQRPEEFQKAIFNILNNNDLIYNMGQKARSYVEKEFSWDKMTKEYVKIIDSHNFSTSN
jgi:glycosyltransferase involved in cell wall biosynthesis